MSQAPYGNSVEPTFTSSPVEAIRSFFHPDEWVENLLWLTLAAVGMVCVVGYIPIFGYGAELIARRSGRPDYPNTRIDSERIGDYFGKGIWPLLVGFVFYLAASPIVFLIQLPIVVVFFFAQDNPAALLLLLLAIPLQIFLNVVLGLCAASLVIRAMIVQDFAKSFDFGWCKHFVQTMWAEMLFTGFVYWLLSGVIAFVGFLMCFVGSLPAAGLYIGGGMHLFSQWYEVYLSKGGIPVPSPEDHIVDASIV